MARSTPLVGIDGYLLDPALVDKAWDFVRLNTTPTAHLGGMRRIDRWPFPEQVVRECIANALAHRDYSIRGSDITLSVFPDRLEIESPGGLPNTVTVERMLAGVRYARNQTLMKRHARLRLRGRPRDGHPQQGGSGHVRPQWHETRVRGGGASPDGASA